MIVKSIEIRDRGTFIPALAVKMIPSTDVPGQYEPERYLLQRAGYAFNRDATRCVMLCRMDAAGESRQASYDPCGWGADDLAFQVAHQYIIDHFDDLDTGAVVDVEFILGETKQPKKSEREQ